LQDQARFHQFLRLVNSGNVSPPERSQGREELSGIVLPAIIEEIDIAR